MTDKEWRDIRNYFKDHDGIATALYIEETYHCEVDPKEFREKCANLIKRKHRPISKLTDEQWEDAGRYFDTHSGQETQIYIKETYGVEISYQAIYRHLSDRRPKMRPGRKFRR